MVNLNKAGNKSNKTVEDEMAKRISTLMVSIFMLVVFGSCTQTNQTVDSRGTESACVGLASKSNSKSYKTHLDHVPSPDKSDVDKYEVTNETVITFMMATGHSAPAYWTNPPLNKPEQPVVEITWFDATTYCEREGKRLPSESKWQQVFQVLTATTLLDNNSRDLGKQSHQQRNTEVSHSSYSGDSGAAPDTFYHKPSIFTEWRVHWTESRDYDDTTVDRHVTFNRTWNSRRANYLNLDRDEVKRPMNSRSRISANTRQTVVVRIGYPTFYPTSARKLGFRHATSIVPGHQERDNVESQQRNDVTWGKTAKTIIGYHQARILIGSQVNKHADHPLTRS